MELKILATRSRAILWLSFFIAFAVFLKNAWVTEDAYIIFRSIEQLFAGNGPRWNPHERVQVFTSPLWFIVLSIGRIFSQNLYLTTLAISGLLWFATLLTLKSLYKNNTMLLLAVLLFTASTGFFDFTSSGLENVLAYFLIGIYLKYYFSIFSAGDTSGVALTGKIKTIIFVFGLLISTRHDLVFLFFPASAFLVFQHRNIFTLRQWIGTGIVLFLPIIVITLYCLIYFGFPFPNTAYAKLNTAIDRMDLASQGVQYLIASLQKDSVTSVIIIAAMCSVFSSKITRPNKFLIAGVILNLLYIISVGGDFMQGRFLSYSFFVSAILLINTASTLLVSKAKYVAFSIVCIYLVVYPHTPFNSPLEYENRIVERNVADERGHYFNAVSLYSYLNHAGEIFPNHRWVDIGIQFNQTSQAMAVFDNIGLFGYFAGLDKIILDPYAISDPLLARMPAVKPWRVGHFKREIPDMYMESIVTDQPLIENPKINEFYEKLITITQSKDLFSAERLKLIVEFNLGKYDFLLLED